MTVYKTVEQRLNEIEEIIKECERTGKDYPGSLVREKITLSEEWLLSQRRF